MLIKLFDFRVLGDERGSLIALESNNQIPFDIHRVYYLYGTKPGVARGFHAHKKLKQLAVCIKGSCRYNKEEVILSTPDKGLLIDAMQWHEMYDFSDDCVLMVLANKPYDESDYIRDYDVFKSEVMNVKIQNN